MPNWDPDLDALKAAPEHHRLLMENEMVRVLETRIPPGETTSLHTHCWPAATYVLSFGHFIRRNGSGEVTMNTQEQGIEYTPGEARWTPVLELHSLQNIGIAPLHVISVEVKPVT